MFTRALPFALSLSLALHGPALAQSCTEDAMLVFDGSGSMSEMGFNRLNRPRIFDARIAMKLAIPRVAEMRRIGLMVYGPGAEQSCRNIDLRFPPRPDAADAIIGAVDGLEPDGETALTEAVAQAAAVLGHQGIVVLVTDGDETCGGAPCRLAEELSLRHPALTVHVIGFRVRDAHFNWEHQGDDDYVSRDSKSRCLADRTGGSYFHAMNVDDFVAALRRTLGCQVMGAVPSAARSSG